MTDRDPWAGVRHLDGQLVTTATISYTEDADGVPWGIAVEPDGLPPAVFLVPSLPGEEDEQ